MSYILFMPFSIDGHELILYLGDVKNIECTHLFDILVLIPLDVLCILIAGLCGNF